MNSDSHVIYDFGANNGDDVAYYLKKARKVVAVDAHPGLCRHMHGRFRSFVEEGRLVILNCALSRDTEEPVTFFVHRRHHVLGQLPAPAADRMSEYEAITIPARKPSGIVAEHGPAHYVKIDVEHYDEHVLADLFDHAIYPAFISAESHAIEVFASLVARGGYRLFNLVDGPSVPVRFASHPIRTAQGLEEHCFPPHSAGPFGEDLPDPWLSPNDFFAVLGGAGLGWKDIHAARFRPGSAAPQG
jgi:FkbM family methyltransferase